VTETAAGNADTAFGEGLRTLPALIDLTNICQAAIMHDTIMCSPMALDSSSFLRSLDCVAKWSFPEAGDEQPPDDETAQGSAPAPTKKDGEEPGALRGDELFLLMGAVLDIRFEDQFFSNLMNLGSLDATQDKGRYAIGKLPVAMLVFQTQHGDEIFEDADSRAHLANILAPTVDRFRAYSLRLIHLYEMHGIDNVSSTIEQPLLDAGRLDHGFQSDELDDIYKEVARRIDLSVERWRGLMLGKYFLPAIGLHALCLAKDLDQLPTVVSRLREDFADLRQTVVTLERERRDAYRRGNRDGEAGRKDIARIKVNLDHAFDAFAKKITDPYITKDIRKANRIMDGARFFDNIMNVVTSAGLGALSSIESALKTLRIDQRLQMRVVPGLFDAAATLENMEVETIGAVVDRFLGLPPQKSVLPRAALTFCFKRIESLYDPSAMDETAGLRFDDTFIPAKTIWVQMIRDEAAAGAWLTGQA
jgi:hypothetical protein